MRPWWRSSAEVVEDFLRAPDREGRDHHVAAPAGERVVERERELVQRLHQALVVAVAVGGLDQQHVGLRDRRRILDDRPPGLAQVAGEDQFLAAGEHLDDRRAEDVARVAKHAAHVVVGASSGAVVRAERDAVLGLAQQAEARLRLGHRVERRAALALGFALLQVGAVGQHDGRAVRRWPAWRTPARRSPAPPGAAAARSGRCARATAARRRSRFGLKAKRRFLRSAPPPPWNMPQSTRNFTAPVSTR